MFSGLALAACFAASLGMVTPQRHEGPPALLFGEDFEGGLGRWIIEGRAFVSIHRTPDTHGAVLRLQSSGDVHALIRGSEKWGNVAVEGDLRFGEDIESYLGFVYNFRSHGQRSDFGLIYLKYGPRVYLQPNPHRDYNVSRKLYPEYVAPLSGPYKARVGEWQKFRVELVDGVSHIYVGEATMPQLTFPIPEPGPGRLGFQPRSVGGEVWIDNVKVTSLKRFSHTGAPQPAPIAPDPSPLRWEVFGPLRATKDAVATDAKSSGWRPFSLDARTALETGRVVDYHGPNTVAYFRTVIDAREAGTAALRLSTIDDLALWLNGRFQGFIPKQDNAWADYWSNPAHKGDEVPLALRSGENRIVIRVRGGTYAAGGFYARVEK